MTFINKVLEKYNLKDLSNVRLYVKRNNESYIFADINTSDFVAIILNEDKEKLGSEMFDGKNYVVVFAYNSNGETKKRLYSPRGVRLFIDELYITIPPDNMYGHICIPFKLNNE